MGMLNGLGFDRLPGFDYKFAGIHAADRCQADDELAHGPRMPLYLRVGNDRALAFIAFGGPLREEGRIERDAVQLIAQIMANHSEGAASLRERMIHGRALIAQADVNRLALEPQQPLERNGNGASSASVPGIEQRQVSCRSPRA
jgi:hypothetical protein